MIRFGDDAGIIDTYPFLIKAIEGLYNEISFIISLPLKGEKGIVNDTGNSCLDGILNKCVPVYPDENNSYEIIFKNYVLHMTRNESYTFWDEYEIRHGKYLILFERSRLLDNISSYVDCNLINDMCKKEYKHYGIYCQNHIIDVITTTEPIIRKYNKK